MSAEVLPSGMLSESSTRLTEKSEPEKFKPEVADSCRTPSEAALVRFRFGRPDSERSEAFRKACLRAVGLRRAGPENHWSAVPLPGRLFQKKPGG